MTIGRIVFCSTFIDYLMLSFRIYIVSSSDFAPGEYRARTTDILDDYKLEQKLQNTYKKVKILYTTEEIPSIKKGAATKLLKDMLSVEGKNQNDGRHHIDISDLIKMVDIIATKCINDCEIQNQKEIAEKRRVQLKIKKQREKDALEETLMHMRTKTYQRTHYSIPSDDESDEYDEYSNDFVVDDDAELSVDSDSQAEEETDESESDDE